MKKLLTIAASAVLCFGIHAEEIVTATRRADGSTNTWTHADLQEALGLLNRKYWRDMESPEGRRKWHGKHTDHYVTNMAERTVERIEIYADGFTNVVKGTKRKLLTPEEEAVRYLERKGKAAKAKRNRIAGLRARITMLEAQTNSYAQAAQPLSEDDSIELSRATINLIQCRKLLKRMEAQATTNIVTVVTGPAEAKRH